MPKFIIADDQVMIREGLRSIISQIANWQVIGEAGDGFDLLPLVEKLVPDIVILDINMPNIGGIENIERMQKLDKKPIILVLSAREDESSVSQAIRSGAKGYLSKSSSKQEIEFSIYALLKGQTYVTPSVTNALLSSSGKHPIVVNPLSALTTREREIMKLLCEGNHNREVAKLLHISPRTIDSHRANIMKKLGISTNAELVQMAIKSGLIE